ncbi:hypothetical protein [Streptomyces aureus]|uniref:hypothetical protein n=1 Tax=Streptomyces aureus TaxID=193461 RepID=UPI0036A4EB61
MKLLSALPVAETQRALLAARISVDSTQFALGLKHPIVGKLIDSAEPVTDVVLSRSTRDGRRFFEKARVWPEGFIVLGDAIAPYNPLFGQGMSVAALGAKALQEELQQGGAEAPGLARRVQQAAIRSLRWHGSSGDVTQVAAPGSAIDE